MKKIIGILSLISLLLFLAVPALAEWSVSGDYVTGEIKTSFLDGALNKVNSQSDLSGGILGLGYVSNSFLFNYDYIYTKLDTAISGSDVNRLHDLRLGHCFYDTPPFKVAVLLSYVCDKCGNFKAKGPTLGLGLEWDLPGQWSFEGRFGYSPTGVTVKNPPAYLDYDDAELLTLAASLNYQLTDCWSVHTSYRKYAFTADNYGYDLKSKVDLFSVGVTWKVSCKAKAE